MVLTSGVGFGFLIFGQFWQSGQILGVCLSFSPVDGIDHSEAQADSRSLRLAVASWVFGLASIPLVNFGVFGIFTLILGFAALRRGNKKGLSSKVLIFAGGGILIGGSTLAIELFRLPAFTTNHGGSRSRMVATALESAIVNFHVEYGILPDVSQSVRTSGPEGVRLLNILLGIEPDSGGNQNPRLIKFLAVREAKGNKNGLQYDDSGRFITGLFDEWGNPYFVELDRKNEGGIRFQYGGRVIELKGRNVAAFSPGKDGRLGTKDDVITW